MSETQLLHHYTTINTLALILKNRTIRFNRLDYVDDIGESHKYGEYNLSRYLFATCWTDSDEENIPLWHMYSKGMTGVRLSLPIDPFDYQPLKPHPMLGGTVTGQLLSFLPIEEIFNNEYMINSTCMFNKKTFIKKVEYVNDDTLTETRKKAVQFKVDENGKEWTTIAGPTELAGYKSKKWEFQAEVRYVIMALPSPPIQFGKDPVSNWVDNFSPFLIKSIKDGTGPNKDFFDVNISQAAVDNIKVTVAPLATESDKIIVEALLQQHTKNGTLSNSSLTNVIRKPIR
jgi:hypothetical protein